MNLKVGDKVRIKSVEEIKKLQNVYGWINDCCFSEDMFEFCNKEFLIDEKNGDLERYCLKNVNDWVFTEDVFELVDEGKEVKKNKEFTKVDEVKEKIKIQHECALELTVSADRVIAGLCDVIDAKNSRQGVLSRELDRVIEANVAYEQEYAEIVNKIYLQSEVLDGLCDTIDAYSHKSKDSLSEIESLRNELAACDRIRHKQIERREHEEELLKAENAKIRTQNDDMRKENAKLKEHIKIQHECALELTGEANSVIAGLCDVIDVKDAKLKKAVREGIVKLELRDKLLKIFNVVVED